MPSQAAAEPTARPVSPITAAANAFVQEHLPAAEALGRELGEQVDDPEAFVRTMRTGMEALVDENYRREQSRVAPGLGDSIGIRLPLLSALDRQLARNSRWAGSDSLLWLAERLLREEGLEVRVIAFHLLA